jgi:hypothetical protein
MVRVRSNTPHVEHEGAGPSSHMLFYGEFIGPNFFSALSCPVTFFLCFAVASIPQKTLEKTPKALHIFCLLVLFHHQYLHEHTSKEAFDLLAILVMQHNMSYRKPVPVYVPSPHPANQELPELFDALNQVEKGVSLVSVV